MLFIDNNIQLKSTKLIKILNQIGSDYLLEVEVHTVE